MKDIYIIIFHKRYKSYIQLFMPILKKELEEHARLSDVKDRQYLVWVIEIAKRGELKKRSWHLKNINGDFLEGCPDIESFEIG